MVKGKQSRKSRGLFRRLYSPVDNLIGATREISHVVLKRGSRVVNNGLGALGNSGKIIASRANRTIRNVAGKKGKSRRNSRKNRKSRSRQN